MKSYTFEEGLALVVKRIAESSERPYVATVHGFPNSGKSTFCKHALNALERVGILCAMAYVRELHSLKDLWFQPKAYFLQDIPPHGPADRYVQENFDKLPNLRILITTAERPTKEANEYNLIILALLPF